MIRLFEGARATVEVGEVPGGYAWRCRTCGGAAGLPPAGPFTDTVLPWGEAVTALDFVLRAASGHADKVCAARRS